MNADWRALDGQGHFHVSAFLTPSLAVPLQQMQSSAMYVTRSVLTSE